MAEGTLEVLLVSGKDLENKHLFSSLDPYCVLTYRTQEKKSKKESGTNPSWNETFLFSLTEGNAELQIKVMDKDTLSDDDIVGEAVIPLGVAIEEGSQEPTSYPLTKRDKIRGEIKVGLKFIPNEGAGGGMGEYGGGAGAGAGAYGGGGDDNEGAGAYGGGRGGCGLSRDDDDEGAGAYGGGRGGHGRGDDDDEGAGAYGGGRGGRGRGDDDDEGAGAYGGGRGGRGRGDDDDEGAGAYGGGRGGRGRSRGRGDDDEEDY